MNIIDIMFNNYAGRVNNRKKQKTRIKCSIYGLMCIQDHIMHIYNIDMC